MVDQGVSDLVHAVNRELAKPSRLRPMLTLENLERDGDDESQAELERLAESLRQHGVEVRVAPLDGPFHAILQESTSRPS